MTALPRDRRYSSVAIAFHWTIALLVILNIIVGLLHDPIPALSAFMPAHKALGLAVLVLTLGRIAWRLAHRPPALPAATKPWERGLAHAAHWGLYALLLAMPISGWIMVSGAAKRRPLNFFDLFDIPYLPVSRAAGEIGGNAHGLLGWLMTALVLLHIAAALRHHLILRDDVLVRMAPALRKG